ncbi:MAG: histidine kinase, partial [Bacteroidales bacterium]|nr:histidine kinase [Bacteroidales bacterium]
GGENGITLFHPGMIVKNTRKPKLQITAFEKFDQIIRRDFTSQNRISLEHDENFFTLHFASLDFTAPEKNQYAYMLEGVNEDWVYPKDENKASYTDIDPGTYTFKVKGSNNDYVWNDQPVSLQIRIYPPFYRTTWFLLLVIFSLGSVAFVFVRMRIQGLKKEKNNVELEQKLLRSQMNPHFIFNSLTSIQNFMLSEEVGKANHYLVKFSKLLRLILSHSRTNYISLSQEIETLEHYLTIQKIRYNQLFEYFLEVSESLDPEKVLIPPMLTQPFVENAIEHGFKLAEYPGRLYVQYAPIGQNIQIVIEDNGIGIERSKQFKATNDKDHQSLATKITRERILNLNRFRKHKIHMEIHDLGKNGDDQQGTRVDIWIPYMLKGANEGRSGNIHKE